MPIAEWFKDSKPRHRDGFRLREAHRPRAVRWNRLWVIAMGADAWLSWVGRSAEDTDWARCLRAPTVRHRTHACGKVGWYA